MDQVASPSVDWKPDPLVTTLPADLQKLPVCRHSIDWNLLRSTESTCGKPFGCAKSRESRRGRKRFAGLGQPLFDWTVRNIQLDATQRQRFRRTARAVRNPAVRPGTAQATGPGCLRCCAGSRASTSSCWPGRGAAGRRRGFGCRHCVIDGKLYLFDPALGLPIPGPGGQGVATLAKWPRTTACCGGWTSTPSILIRVKSSDLQQCGPGRSVAIYLSQRMAWSRSRWPASSNWRSPSRPQQPGRTAESCRACPRRWAVAASLSTVSWRTAPAMTAHDAARTRTAHEFCHRRYLRSDGTAANCISRASLSTGETRGRRTVTMYQLPGPSTGHRGLANAVRRWPGSVQQQQSRRIEALQIGTDAGPSRTPATGWACGVRAGDYAAAIDYFDKRTLDAKPKGPWTAAARYNLARTYEATGRDMPRPSSSTKPTQSPPKPRQPAPRPWLKSRRQHGRAKPSRGKPLRSRKRKAAELADPARSSVGGSGGKPTRRSAACIRSDGLLSRRVDSNWTASPSWRHVRPLQCFWRRGGLRGY